MCNDHPFAYNCIRVPFFPILDNRERHENSKLSESVITGRKRVEKLAIKPTTTSNPSSLRSFRSLDRRIFIFLLFLLLPFSNLVQMLFQHLTTFLLRLILIEQFWYTFSNLLFVQRQFVRLYWPTFVVQSTQLVVFSRDRSRVIRAPIRITRERLKNIWSIRKIAQD